MNSHNIHIPRPSRFISLEEVDSIAQKFSRSYQEYLGEVGVPIDIERFMDWLEISYCWVNVGESDGANCFARIDLNRDTTVEINEHYKELFEKRPDVYRTCIGHESGHVVLKHIDCFSNADTPTLLSNPEIQYFLHKESWGQYGLSSSEVRQRKVSFRTLRDKLVKNAFLSPTAYNAIKSMEDKFEPEWMFWQAEHFARCIAIPTDELYDTLEREPLSSGWASIGRLARIFDVPLGSMRLRLEKLKLIEMDAEDKPVAVVNMQGSLF